MRFRRRGGKGEKEKEKEEIFSKALDTLIIKSYHTCRIITNIKAILIIVARANDPTLDVIAARRRDCLARSRNGGRRGKYWDSESWRDGEEIGGKSEEDREAHYCCHGGRKNDNGGLTDGR